MEAKVIVNDALEWLDTFGVERESSMAKRHLVADLIDEEYKELLESLDSAPAGVWPGGINSYLHRDYSSDPLATVDALVDLIWVAANFYHFEGKKFLPHAELADEHLVRGLPVAKYEAVTALRKKTKSVRNARNWLLALIHVAHHAGMTYYPTLFPKWAARVRKANFAKLWTLAQRDEWERVAGNPKYNFSNSKVENRYVARRADGKIMKPPGWKGPEYYA